MTRASTVPCKDSRLYVVNDTARIDFVSICELTAVTSDNIRIVYAGALHGRHYNKGGHQQICDALDDFRVNKDVILVTGRAFVNMTVGIVLQQKFAGERIYIAQYDAKFENYKIDRIALTPHPHYIDYNNP